MVRRLRLVALIAAVLVAVSHCAEAEVASIELSDAVEQFAKVSTPSLRLPELRDASEESRGIKSSDDNDDGGNGDRDGVQPSCPYVADEYDVEFDFGNQKVEVKFSPKEYGIDAGYYCSISTVMGETRYAYRMLCVLLSLMWFVY